MALKLSCLSKKRKRLNKNQILFDDLTNEIYYEIFDYLTYNDIIKSFSNLNNRLKQIIGNYPHNINLEIDENIPKFIRSLKITLNSQLDLFNSLKTNQFLSLRSIAISNLRYNEIKSCNQSKSLNINKYQWINIFPKQLNYFYLKSIPNASIHLDKKFSTQHLQNPLNENINLTSDQNQEHICQMIIEGILIKYYVLNDFK
ncbi:unnamed protein product [Adineta steineri]|uniref:F-box domain-containing protein n=1 Tax=Adineta steineri TaxID=433720 RepID=A0A815X3P6_9BILA|nr:unnamed protein product [Adineta steineri]CAF1661483.1 unnamed protein product [Adineta steineri]